MHIGSLNHSLPAIFKLFQIALRFHSTNFNAAIRGCVESTLSALMPGGHLLFSPAKKVSKNAADRFAQAQSSSTGLRLANGQTLQQSL